MDGHPVGRFMRTEPDRPERSPPDLRIGHDFQGLGNDGGAGGAPANARAKKIRRRTGAA